MIKITRETRETKIALTLEVYGSGETDILTGVGFFDHMLTAFAVHGNFDICVKVEGDLHVDCHHTIEDVGIVLGKAFCEALGNKGGIQRFGTAYVPMDEALAFASVDVSGRPYLVYECPQTAPMIGTYDTQMTQEFLRAFAYHSLITLHAKCLYGENMHHMAEGIYKAVARAMKEAVEKTQSGKILSTKGAL